MAIELKKNSSGDSMFEVVAADSYGLPDIKEGTILSWSDIIVVYVKDSEDSEPLPRFQ